MHHLHLGESLEIRHFLFSLARQPLAILVAQADVILGGGFAIGIAGCGRAGIDCSAYITRLSTR